MQEQLNKFFTSPNYYSGFSNSFQIHLFRRFDQMVTIPAYYLKVISSNL